MPDSVIARIIIELVAIVGLLSLNGLFALSEIAVVSANRARLQQLSINDSRAERVLRLADEPTDFLSTVQIGITLIGILAGALSGATLSTELAKLFRAVVWLESYAELLSFIVVVAFVTLLSLLIGELIPKSIALSNPERFAMAIAPPMQILARVTSPLVSFLSLLTTSTLKFMRIESNEQPPVTEDELKTLLVEGTRAGIFEPMEEHLVTQALELDDISLQPILTHRTQTKWLDVNASPDTWFQLVAENSYRVFPVCDGNMDQTLGIVKARDLLLAFNFYWQANKSIELEQLIQPALFLPLTATPASLLKHFQDSQVSMVLVVDEYGGVEGIVTQTDILIRLTGSAEI